MDLKNVDAGALRMRPYQNEDYAIIEPWFDDLAKFYDGHSKDNKLIDQLINASKKDKKGFFTLRKELWIAKLGNKIAGFYCLNFKRGGSVKLGPFVTNPNLRGLGVGRKMMEWVFEHSSGCRKIYATTNEKNHPINHIFRTTGFKQEVLYTDHYKRNSNEIVWGMSLLKSGDVDDRTTEESLLKEGTGARNIKVRHFKKKDLEYLRSSCDQFLAWHDDLGDDFVQSIVSAWQRANENGISFQDKSKWILIAESAKGYEGIAILSPKRGGPVKMYPLSGTKEGQRRLLAHSIMLSQMISSHKLYTFCSSSDFHQKETLESFGFTSVGDINQPYKSNTRISSYEYFFKEPDVHSIRIYGQYLDMIEDGRKPLEGRCNTSMFRKIMPGHRINFSSSKKTVSSVVIRKSVYSSFKEMLDNESRHKLLPGEHRDPVRIYMALPKYAQKSKKFGVVCFEVVPYKN